MQRTSFAHDAEFAINDIYPMAMLAHYLNRHHHEDWDRWQTEYKIWVPAHSNMRYGGEVFIDSQIVGRNEKRLSHDQALQIIYDYEAQANPDTPCLKPSDTAPCWGTEFERHLKNRWEDGWNEPNGQTA